MLKFEIDRNNKLIESQFLIKEITDYSEFSPSIKEDMNTLITHFNKQYSWDEMFNIDDVVNRILNGEKLFILYFNTFPIGYVFFKKINDNTCFGYNLFVSKKQKRPGYAPYWFYKKVTKYMLTHYNKIKVEVEDWNFTIIDIIKNIGYYNTN
jgi:hypothetical protein